MQETASLTPLLIKTATCPACRTAIFLLDRAGIRYTTVLADEAPDTARRYDVHHVPTLILPHADGSHDTLVGADAIRDYVKEQG